MTIIFGYCDTESGTFTTQSFEVDMYKVTPAFDSDETQELKDSREILESSVIRLRVELEVSQKNFGDNDPSFTKYKYLGNWQAARYKRISTNGTAIFGFSTWNATNNTAFLVHESEPQWNVANLKVANVVFTMKTSKETTI